MNETIGRMGVTITVDNKQAISGFESTKKAARSMATDTAHSSKNAARAMKPYSDAVKDAQNRVKSAISTTMQADKATLKMAQTVEREKEAMKKAADATKAAKDKRKELIAAGKEMQAAGRLEIPTNRFQRLTEELDNVRAKVKTLTKEYKEASAIWNQVANNPPKSLTSEYLALQDQKEYLERTMSYGLPTDATEEDIARRKSYQRQLMATKLQMAAMEKAGTHEYVDWKRYDRLRIEAENAAKALSEARQRGAELEMEISKLEASGGAWTTSNEARRLIKEYDELNIKIKQLEDAQSAAVQRFAASVNEEVDAKMRARTATDEQIEAERALQAAIVERNRAARMVAGVEYSQRRAEMLAEYARKWGEVTKRVKHYANTMKSAAAGTVGWLKKMAHGFGKIYQKIPLLGKIPKSIKGIKRGLMTGMGLRGMIRMGVTGFGIYKALSMAREGMQNLSRYSAQTNKDISMLKSSLATLKNALATAFAPILTVIAPYISAFIDMLTRAATAIAHFTAAFTGKSTVVVAKKQTVDYAASLDGVADSADSANSSAKDLQNTLLGFDQMEILQKNESSSGSGGAGGAGGGAGGVDDMFETVDVSDDANSLVDKIKDAWEKADFSEFGIALGNKINNALGNIPWDSIIATAEKFAKSLTSFLNGFISETDWSLVGSTIANGINTAITFFGTFAKTFDWSGAGAAVKDAINGFIADLDWKGIGTTIGDFIVGGIEFLGTAIDGINWEALTTGVLDAITALPWSKIIKEGLKLAEIVVSVPVRVVGTITEYVLDKNTPTDSAGNSLSTVGPNAGGDLVTQALNGSNTLTFNPKGPFTVTSIIDKIPDNQRDVRMSALLKSQTVDIPSADRYVNAQARLTSKKDMLTSAQKVIDKVKANITKKKDAIASSNKLLSGFKAKLTSKLDAIGSKVLSGFTAKLTSKIDALSSHTLGGFTAEISDIKATKNARNQVVALTRADGGLYRNGRWMPVTAAAGGGSFTTGQMFVAREAGPELVGRIGSGTTVMNNDQIVSSVSRGVYEAVVSAMAGNDKSVNVYLMGDAGKMFKVVQKEAIQYMNTTGLSPFPV